MDGYSGCETCFKYFSPLKKYIYIYVFLASTSGALYVFAQKFTYFGITALSG